MKDDGAKCYALAHDAMREIKIRNRKILPSGNNETESRWLREGPKPYRELEIVKGG